MSERLLPCPFCGGPAMFEDITSTKFGLTTWSVGCANTDEDCIGYQMLAHFSRKSEAAEAWNKRAPQSSVVNKPAWPRVFNVKRSKHNTWHGEISFARCPTDAELSAIETALRAEPQGDEYVKLANEHLARCMDENQALLARIDELTSAQNKN